MFSASNCALENNLMPIFDKIVEVLPLAIMLQNFAKIGLLRETTKFFL